MKQSSRRAPLVMLCCTLGLLLGGAWAVAARSGGRARSQAPPTPRIGARPSAHTDVRWALFTVTDREHGVTFECALDGLRFKRCGARALFGLIESSHRAAGKRARGACGHAPRGKRARSRSCKRRRAQRLRARHSRRARGRRAGSRQRSVLRGAGRLLALGRHTFRVRARSRAGKVSRTASYTWVILTRAQLEALEHRASGGGSTGGSGTTGGAGAGAGAGQGSSGGSSGGSAGGSTEGEGEGTAPSPRPKSFAISGQPEGDLYPGGPALEIPLTIFNPNPAPIQVTSLVVMVSASPAGCKAEENVRIVQSDVSGTSPLTVPAGQSVTLPTQGDSAPTIQFLNLPVNQDACKGATFPLVYAGSAHS